MKKFMALLFVVIIAVLSVMSVSAAPGGHYIERTSLKPICTSDAYGCRTTDENGESKYLMFWTDASRAKIMGPGSDIPVRYITNTFEAPTKVSDNCADHEEEYDDCMDQNGYWDYISCICTFTMSGL